MKNFVTFGFLAIFIFFVNLTQAQKKSNKSLYLKSAATATEISKVYNKFERFKLQILGHFSNQEQVAEGTTEETLQEFIVIPILEDRPNEFWVYLEFFSPSMIESPLDQRVEQYVKIDRDTFRMEVYYLKEPEKFVNCWKDNKFPKLDIREDLIRDEACDLLIAHQEEKPGTFKTLFPEEVTCEMLTSTSAARYVDLEFELEDEGYLMWFSFYDRNKQHLKTTGGDGLSFRRTNQTMLRYKNLLR